MPDRPFRWLFIGLSSLGLSFAAAGFSVSSAAFREGQPVPAKYACAANAVNPPLTFTNSPTGTKSYAILGWDTDAPGGLASSWVVYDIPASTSGLPEAVPIGANVMGFKQGTNTAGKLGYTGPCPTGVQKRRQLFFDLYALDTPSLGLPAGASLSAVHAAITKHRLREAKLMALAAR